MRKFTIRSTLFVFAAAAASAQPTKMIPAPPDVEGAAGRCRQDGVGAGLESDQAGHRQGPSAQDRQVKVHYTGWTTDGKMFDSSVGGATRDVSAQPRHRGLDRRRSADGGRRKAAPLDPGGARLQGKRDPRGMLVFDVELLSIAAAPQAPADVKAPPADAKKTPSGLAYKVLTPGTGTRNPSPRSKVTVHYSGWTTDGKMFDSSVTRGEPITFPLDGVIAGWTEGVQLMVEGEKTRFWIPESLAYKGQQPPFGMLVFDVELLKIQLDRSTRSASRTGAYRDRSCDRPVRPVRRPLAARRCPCALPDAPARALESDRRARAHRSGTWPMRASSPAPDGPLPPRRASGCRRRPSRRSCSRRALPSTSRPGASSATAPRRRSRGRAGERSGELFDAADERFHPFAVRVGIEIGAREDAPASRP